MRAGVLQLQRAGVLDRLAGTPAIRRVELVFDDELVGFRLTTSTGSTPTGPTANSSRPHPTRRRCRRRGQLSSPERRSSGSSAITGAEWLASRVDRRRDRSPSRPKWWSVPTGSTPVSLGRSPHRCSTPHLRPTPLSMPTTAASNQVAINSDFTRQRNVGLIPTDDGLTLVFAGGPRDRSDDDLDSTLRLVAPDLARSVHEAERVERFRRSNGIPSVLRDPVGDGWTLVGDAGFSRRSDRCPWNHRRSPRRRPLRRGDRPGLARPEPGEAALWNYRATRDSSRCDCSRQRFLWPGSVGRSASVSTAAPDR